VIQEGMIAKLQSCPVVTTLAGGNVYSVLAPSDQCSYPCVSYRLIGGSQSLTFGHFGNREQRVEFAAHAFDYPTAVALRDAVTVCLQDWKEVLSDGTDVTLTTLANPGTDFLGDDRIFSCLVEFYVFYNSPN
jgi:hypothetical protein